MKNSLYILILIILFCGCKKNIPIECSDNIGLYKFSKYPIGCAINFDFLNNDNFYRNISLQQFNSITPENIFKASFLHPSESVFDWVNADSLVRFCKINQKRLHGHTLLWHQQLPNWMNYFQGNLQQWEAMMKSHIQTIITHFKNDVKAWDVVNEAFNEDGTLRNNIWKQHLEDSYLEKAYNYAKDVDANILLFYNDYNIESNNNKRQAVLQCLNNLRNRGVKIDGIGLQMHINTYSTDQSEIANTIKLFSDNGYKVHLSEVDISVNPLSLTSINKEIAFQRQANLLGGIIKAYNQLPQRNQYGITFWGISDKDSWIPAYYNRIDYPLLYDDNYSPKPMYCALKNNL